MFLINKSIKPMSFFYIECWKENPEERPQMSKVVEILNLEIDPPADVQDSEMDVNLDPYITSSIEKNIFINSNAASNDNYDGNFNNNISLLPASRLLSQAVIVDYEKINDLIGNIITIYFITFKTQNNYHLIK